MEELNSELHPTEADSNAAVSRPPGGNLLVSILSFVVSILPRGKEPTAAVVLRIALD